MNQLSKYPHLKWYVSNLKSIPGGTYRWQPNQIFQEPGIRITVSPFRMGATPVTWAMWKEYRQSFAGSGSAVPGTGIKLPEDPGWGYPNDHPVVNVSWDDVMRPGGYCEWASGVAGFKLTLPTDAQWEYAARGGKDKLEYPWGNDWDSSLVWCARKWREIDRTAPVDRVFRIYRNAYGLTDMVGNVWQWCADYYNEDFRPAGKDPVCRKQSKQRCVRSGWWSSFDREDFRCNFRGGSDPRQRNNNGGFRLCAAPR